MFTKLAVADSMLDETQETQEMIFCRNAADEIYYVLGRIGSHNVFLACLPIRNTRFGLCCHCRSLNAIYLPMDETFWIWLYGGSHRRCPNTEHNILLDGILVNLLRDALNSYSMTLGSWTGTHTTCFIERFGKS